jgi:hypothetical protein
MLQIHVFFYGLFLDTDLLTAKGINPQNPVTAHLKDYAIRIGNRATLVPAENKHVYGILMSLTHPEIDLLYSAESLSAYRAEPVMTHTSEGRMPSVLCFNLVQPPALHERNEEYAAKLKIPANRCGLPEDYVHSIG